MATQRVNGGVERFHRSAAELAVLKSHHIESALTPGQHGARDSLAALGELPAEDFGTSLRFS